MEDLNLKQIILKIKKSKRVLLLLDYDGTLVNFEPNPHEAKLSSANWKVLNCINKLPGVELVITTGRGFNDIEILLDDSIIDILAEHGSMYRKKGVWSSLIPPNNSWNLLKIKIMPYLSEIANSCRHSFIEEKLNSVCWHYRNADIHEGIYFAEKLEQILEILTISTEFKVLKGKCVIEVGLFVADKGTAIQYLLRNNQYDLVIGIGDDKTDEDMFLALSKEDQISIKVGEGESIAQYRISTIEETWAFLERIIL